MARTTKKKETVKETATVVTRAEKKDATKNLIREIDADKKLKLGVLDLLPDFDNLVTLYEIKWLKSRNDFNVIEQDIVTNEFKKLYAKRINKLMGDK